MKAAATARPTASESHDVFISYSWDSEEHVKKVLSLAQGLRAHGVDAWVDKFDHPSVEWPLWCYNQIDGANHVLVVCTETYDRRVRREDAPGIGRGATWEGAILTNAIYNRTRGQDKFIPVIFSAADARFVPYFIAGYSLYDVSERSSLTELYALLTGQPTVVPEPIGRRVTLSRQVLETALPVGEPTAQVVRQPERAVPLKGVIEGSWIADVQAPMFGGTVTMRVVMTKSLIGKRRFEAQGVVGPPGWTGSGTWEILPPGNRVALQGTQMAQYPYPQVGPLQEQYTFNSITRDVLTGTNAAGGAVTWQRE